jgi:MFS superfamily sulfate permease-like transporter
MGDEGGRQALNQGFGAFADGAILFPLLAVLASLPGYSATLLLASAGFAYLISGVWFQVPMPVQPLKALVIGGIAVGATASEIRWGGALIGIVCLGLYRFRAERWMERLPKPLVHGLQGGVGILLVTQGFKQIGGIPGVPSVLILWAGLGALAIVALTNGLKWPVLGWCAVLGLGWGLIHGKEYYS